MSHIAMLLPREEMVRQAQDLVKNEGFHVQEIRCVSTADAVEEASASVAAGTSVIVARGLQAMRISQALNIPVVQVRITVQEIGLLLLKAKRYCASPRPKIALVAAENMLCDISCCNLLFGVELRQFSYASMEEYAQANQEAIQWGPEAIIGGDQAMEAAQAAGITNLFLDFIDDSLREAIRAAETALYASEQNQRANAQFDALLNSSTSGYIQLDERGRAVKVNDIMAEIMGCSQKELVGEPLEELIPGLDKRAVDEVLSGGNSYSSFLHIHYQAIVAILSPIRFEDGRVEGAVLSCHKVHRNIQLDPHTGIGAKGQGNISDRTFDNVHQKSPLMKRAVHQAQLFSQSSNPILILGERGLERNLLAQCIHNNSLNRTGPFVQVNCGGLSPQRQMEALFGTGEKKADGEMDLGAFGTANNGTLFLMELDKLIPSVQYSLYRALRYHRITQHDFEHSAHVNARLVATSETDLYAAMKEGTFRTDLYYLLSGLKINVPPLRERPEDLGDILEESFRKICDSFRRYHVLTNGAWERLRGYPWYGNAVQINSYLERMVLTCTRRTIDEVFVQDLWDEMYPELQPGGDQRMVVYKSPEALRLTEILERNGGSRALTAKELGISTTTLWRRMKKLGISGHFEG